MARSARASVDWTVASRLSFSLESQAGRAYFSLPSAFSSNAATSAQNLGERLLLVHRQFGQGRRVTDAGEVGVLLPMTRRGLRDGRLSLARAGVPPTYRCASSSRCAGLPAAAARITVQQVDSEVGTDFLMERSSTVAAGRRLDRRHDVGDGQSPHLHALDRPGTDRPTLKTRGLP